MRRGLLGRVSEKRAATAVVQRIKGVVSTGSGTTVDIFTGVSGVERIELWYDDVSLDAANPAPIVQLSTGATFKTSGYTGAVAGQQGGSSQFDINGAGFIWAGTTIFAAADTVFGLAVLRHLGSNLWGFSSNIVDSNGGQHYGGGGYATLTGELDGLRLTTEGGTAAYDNGNIRFYREEIS